MLSDKDRANLRALAIFHFFLGTLLSTCFGMSLISAVLALADEESGGMFVLMIVATLWGAGHLLTGIGLVTRKFYVFNIVMAGFMCLNFPVGTALGATTIAMLCKEDVKRAFGRLPEEEEAGVGNVVE